MTTAARMIQVGDHAPEQDRAPDIFTGTTFTISETLIALNALTSGVKQLKHSHETKNLSAMKLDAEVVARAAKQISVLNEHLAGVCCRHLARKPRIG